MDKYEKLEKLFIDEEKAESVFSGTPTEVLVKLAENGIDMTEDELKAFVDGFKAVQGEYSRDELDEADLESVAGGCERCYNFGKKVGSFVRKAAKVAAFVIGLFG